MAFHVPRQRVLVYYLWYIEQRISTLFSYSLHTYSIDCDALCAAVSFANSEMAAATAPAHTIDLKAPATYNVRLGSSILDPVERAERWASVRYNHRPRLGQDRKTSASISSTGKENASELLLRDGGDEYGYVGEHQAAQDSYVLVLRGSGNETEAVLERLNGSYAFNLTSTPDETDAAKLEQRYPHITTQHGEHSGMRDEAEAAEEAVDAENPFDYRHFLKAAPQSKARRLADTEATRSGTGTPLAQPRAQSNTPLSRPAKRPADSALVQQKKRKATPSSTDNADVKRVKAGSAL